MPVIFDLIKRCLDSGYELSFRKDLLGMIHIEVSTNRLNRRKGYHQCKQVIPNDDHLYKMNEVVLYCIQKVDELVMRHYESLKLKDNGGE